MSLWDMHDCAEFLGIAYDTFRKTRHNPLYPKPVDLPGRPRWRPEDWQNQRQISNQKSDSRQTIVSHGTNTHV